MTTLDDVTATARTYAEELAALALDLGRQSRDAEVAALTAQVEELKTRPPVVEVNPDPHPVPADAVVVSPTGLDVNPGTVAKPRLHPIPGRDAVLEGAFPGWSWFAPNGSRQSLYVPRGKTATLDGQGKLGRALTLGGFTNLYGDLRVTGHVPPYSRTPTCVPVYYGGTSAGSEIDGPTIAGSNMAGFGFEVPLVLTKLTVDRCGYSGILGTTADGTYFGDVAVRRVNRSGRTQDGQLGAIKITRSRDLLFSRDVLAEDTGGAQGIWTDVSCRNPIAAGARVLTAGGKPAEIGIHFEEAEGGAVVGCETEGVFALQLLASGRVRVLGNKATGTSVAANVQQDRPANDGSNPANLSTEAASWWAILNELNGNTLRATGGHKIALMVYADHEATGKLDADRILASLKGNTYDGTVQLGKLDGTRPPVTLAQAAQLLGPEFSAIAPPIPPYLAALLR